MPGPGQGKRSHKKKWRENVSNLNMNIAAVNTVMMASSTAVPNARTATATPSDKGISTLHANEMAAKTTSYKTLQPTTTITTVTISANTAGNDAINAGEATRVDTATDTSSTNNVGSQQRPFTYTHKEVWQLIEDAQIDGWQEGYEEGSRKWSEGHEAGYEAGQKMGKEKEEMLNFTLPHRVLEESQ